MRRLFALAIVMALVLAACGGESGDDGGENEPTQPDATQPADDDNDQPDPTQPPDDPGDSEGEGPSTATVTLNGETYEFSSEGAVVAQCLTDLFGIMIVQLPMADGGDGSVMIQILHPGTDPSVVEQNNAVTVTIGDVDWIADPEDFNIIDNPDVPAGQSEVTSSEFDGRTVRGTANLAGSTTIYSADFVEFGEATFEATCGEERTS